MEYRILLEMAVQVNKKNSFQNVSYGLVYLILVYLMLLATVAGCSITNTVRKHPEYSALSSSIKSIYVLPPEVVITHKALSESDSRASKKEETLLKIFSEQIPSYINQQGITVPDMDFDQAFGTTSELTLEQLRSAYRKASIDLHKHEIKSSSHKSFVLREKNEPIVNLGSVASYVSKQLSTDALMIVRYIGFEIYTGGIVMDRIDSAMSSQITTPFVDASTFGGVFEIALIDGKSGDIIWINSNVQVAKPGQVQQNWSEVTQTLLKKLKFNKPPESNSVYTKIVK